MISDLASASELSDLGVRVGSAMDSPLVESLAVVATFDPEQAVPEEQRDPVAALCDRLVDRDRYQEWMLKERVRVSVLARMLRRDGSSGLAGARGPIRPHDTALQRVLDLAVLQRPVEIEALDEQELAAALHVRRWCASAGSYGGVPEFAAAFDRERIEGRLALLETLRPLREITRDGVVGREDELARLHDYVSPAGRQLALYDRPRLSVYGLGGVGKSTLIAQFLLDLAARPQATAWAYLDLDRPSLATFDPLTVLNDINRQVGAELPETRRFLDHSGREGLEHQKGTGLEGSGSESWRLVASQLASAVNAAAGGRLVVVLDTYEEMQRADATSGHRFSDVLYEMFSELSVEATEFRLVISGRAPDSLFRSVGGATLLHVEAFRGAAARDVLQHLYARELERRPERAPTTRRPLAEGLVDEVVAAVGGTPLTLRLAARVLALEGVEGLDDVAARAQALGRVTDEFVKGFLYHRILGHIRGVDRSHRQALRDVARASLVLRHLDVPILSDVILPAIGRPELDPGEMLSGLMVETALTDMQAGTARLRDELRGPALLALRYVEPDLVTDVHQRAAAYYAAHRELPAAAVELAYHRLALGDPDGLVGLDPLAFAAVERSVADLPPASRALVVGAVAGPAVLDEELAAQARERAIETKARRALDAGDLDAAARALDSQERWSPTTRLFQLLTRLEEARGDDDATLAAARSDLAAALRAEDPARYAAAAIHLALIMERLADVVGASAVLADADAQPWLAGQTLLRLEVQLNRIAILDRSAAGDWPVDRWLLELDARALLHRADPGAVRSTTALVRLLAATLSADQSSLVVDAFLSLGLGTTTYSTHLRTLAQALAEWDMDRASPGLIASSVGLSTTDPPTVESLTEAWFQAVAVQTSADTVPLLERAFSLEPPSARVVAALRRIYLWWDMDPQPGRVDASSEPSGGSHFLDGAFDLADAGAQQLLRTLTGAYPVATDLEVLAAQTGLDVGSLNMKTTRSLSTRSLLDEAASAGKLPDLIGVVLGDRKAAAFHDQLRDVVGTDWLDQHGITPRDTTEGARRETPTVVDSHSHIFNADDIPIDGFLKHKLRIPTLLTAVFAGPLEWLATRRAPGPEEAARLIELIQRAIDARTSGLESIPGDQWEGAVVAEEILTDDELDGRLIASLAAQQPVTSDGRPGLESVGGLKAVGDVDAMLERLVAGASPEQLAELEAWSREQGAPDVWLEGFPDPRKIVRELKAAASRLREVLRLISQPRHLVVGELARTYGDVHLFVPTLVDFDLTSHDEPAMAVHRQISMHSLVAKLSVVGGIPGAPEVRMHPFVAFCPYREVLHSELRDWDVAQPNPYVPYADPAANAPEDRFRRDLRFDLVRARKLTDPVGPWKSATWELGGVTRSLDLVRHAIERGGFAGVKLYPPSGFLPIGNAGQFGERVGTRLDTALRALYRYCQDLGVPILAHASCSNGFERGWDQFAAPAGWAAVLKDYPQLRLSFGHFGHLQGAKESDPVPPAKSWPMQYLALMDAYDHVYADVGCSRYAFDDQVYGPRFDRFLRKILGPLDGGDAIQEKRRRRLMFGSDYWMNTLAAGHQAAYDRFSHGIESQFGAATLDQFRGGNALRWLGFTDESDRVDPGSPSRDRLVSFSDGQPLPPWLTV